MIPFILPSFEINWEIFSPDYAIDNKQERELQILSIWKWLRNLLLRLLLTKDTVLRCSLTEAKLYNAFLKFIFWWKCVKFGCMTIEMQIRQMTFSFLCQCYRTRVPAVRFSRVPLFHHFYPKTDSNAQFDSVFTNNGRFNRKKVNALD